MATVRKGYERRKSTGDILLPIPADVAPFEQTNIASEAHPKGSFFYYNNTFYEATSAISTGGTISPGSNCTAKTVAQVLYELNSSSDTRNDIDWSSGTEVLKVSATGGTTSSKEYVVTKRAFFQGITNTYTVPGSVWIDGNRISLPAGGFSAIVDAGHVIGLYVSGASTCYVYKYDLE